MIIIKLLGRLKDGYIGKKRNESEMAGIFNFLADDFAPLTFLGHKFGVLVERPMA